MSEGSKYDVVEIRSYEAGDRLAVRQISCDTADKGKPVERFFRDREAAADILTRYYTDYEPGSLSVAETGNVVVGYIAGCLDTRTYNSVMMRKILPKALAGASARGALWRMETWRLLTALAGSGLFRIWDKIDLDTYPAHFHINLIQDFRGKRIGLQLAERFKQKCDNSGVRGIHVEVLGDNRHGRRFFEGLGFRALCERTLILPEENRLRKSFTIVYGWANK